MASIFEGTIEFFADIGVYEVVLPFLLVFTIVFAILEKSRIFGVVEVEGTSYTRKNLNAMVAFVIAFLIVGSSQMVAVINQAVAHMVLLLLLSILFLLLAGSFHKDEEFYLQKSWNRLFMTIMFVGIILIFANAIGWLEPFWFYIITQWDSVTVSSFVLLLFIVLFIWFITKDPGHKSSGSKEEH